MWLPSCNASRDNRRCLPAEELSSYPTVVQQSGRSTAAGQQRSHNSSNSTAKEHGLTEKRQQPAGATMEVMSVSNLTLAITCKVETHPARHLTTAPEAPQVLLVLLVRETASSGDIRRQTISRPLSHRLGSPSACRHQKTSKKHRRSKCSSLHIRREHRRRKVTFLLPPIGYRDRLQQQ